MKPRIVVLAFCLAFAACSAAEERSVQEDLRTFDLSEEAPSAPYAPPAPAQAGEAASQPQAPERVAAGAPQIAYSYGYVFRLSADRIAEVQERHLDLCHTLGPQRCRVVSMQRDASSGNYARASLTLQVAAPIARQFGDRLAAAAGEAGAETIDRTISGEDLSRPIIDAEARIQTRETLVGRLTQLLETRSGNIQQAVEAERAINQAQEELEAARGWLNEMRTRVAMSTFTLAYESGAPLAGGVREPLREAFARTGSLFAESLSLLVLIIAGLLPWALLLFLIVFLVRAARRRGWIGHRDEEEASQPAPEPGP